MRKILTLGLSLGLIFTWPSTAQAMAIRRTQAPLLNTAGADSTCVLTTRGTVFSYRGEPRLVHKAEVLCTKPWLRHKSELSAFVVLAGRRVPIYTGGSGTSIGLSTSASTSSGGPICQQNAWGLPWSPQPGITYQIVLSSRATVKDTSTYLGEPWFARAEKLIEVTC